MSEQPPVGTRPKTAALAPTFLGGLRGIWLFTWKTQITWQKLSMTLASLLALPVLIYLTTSSPQDWARRNRPVVGDPRNFVNTVSKKLARAGEPLQAKQRSDLRAIIAEEYARTQTQWAEAAQSADSNPDQQRSDVEECQGRIRKRAEGVLNERQLAEFQDIQLPNRFDARAPLADLKWNRTAPFYHWLIDLYFFILLPLNCVKMCGAVVRDELDADTLGFLTTRPVSRARLVILKYISHAAWLQLWLLVQTLLLFAAGALRDVPALVNLLPLFLAAQFLAVLAFGALGLFLGLVSKKYMALALVYGVVVEMGIGRIPTNINTLSLMRHLKTLLGHDPVLQTTFSWPAVGALGPIAALVLATTLFLSLSALMFTFKEYHHTAETQK